MFLLTIQVLGEKSAFLLERFTVPDDGTAQIFKHSKG